MPHPPGVNSAGNGSSGVAVNTNDSSWMNLRDPTVNCFTKSWIRSPSPVLRSSSQVRLSPSTQVLTSGAASPQCSPQRFRQPWSSFQQTAQSASSAQVLQPAAQRMVFAPLNTTAGVWPASSAAAPPPVASNLGATPPAPQQARSRSNSLSRGGHGSLARAALCGEPTIFPGVASGPGSLMAKVPSGMPSPAGTERREPILVGRGDDRIQKIEQRLAEIEARLSAAEEQWSEQKEANAAVRESASDLQSMKNEVGNLDEMVEQLDYKFLMLKTQLHDSMERANIKMEDARNALTKITERTVRQKFEELIGHASVPERTAEAGASFAAYSNYSFSPQPQVKVQSPSVPRNISTDSPEQQAIRQQSTASSSSSCGLAYENRAQVSTVGDETVGRSDFISPLKKNEWERLRRDDSGTKTKDRCALQSSCGEPAMQVGMS